MSDRKHVLRKTAASITLSMAFLLLAGQAASGTVCSVGCDNGESQDSIWGDVQSLMSDGGDGAYSPQLSGILSRDVDGVFNFTDVYIPEGVEVTLPGVGGPDAITYILASGDINIGGSLTVTDSSVALIAQNRLTLNGSVYAPGAGLLLAAGDTVAVEPGGTLGISAPGSDVAFVATGQILLSGGFSSFGLSPAQFGEPPSLEVIGNGVPVVFNDLPVIVTPLPAGWLLFASAFGLLASFRILAQRGSGFLSRPAQA